MLGAFDKAQDEWQLVGEEEESREKEDLKKGVGRVQKGVGRRQISAKFVESFSEE